MGFRLCETLGGEGCAWDYTAGRWMCAMASSVGLREAQEHLGELLDRVERGEEIVIERDGRAVSKLVPVAPSEEREANDGALKQKSGRRRFGDNFLGITYIPPDFYDDLPLEMFEILRENGNSSK
jgi:prevent-host-death family protein